MNGSLENAPHLHGDFDKAAPVPDSPGDESAPALAASPERCPSFDDQPAFPPAVWEEALEAAALDSDVASCFPVGDSVETATGIVIVVKGNAEGRLVMRLLEALAFLTPGKGVVDAGKDEVNAPAFSVVGEGQQEGGA